MVFSSSPEERFHLQPSQHQVERTLLNLMRRGLVFMVEHHHTASSTDSHYWTLWQLPIAAKDGDVAEGLEQLLRAVGDCARQFPSHYVRITAYDQQRQCQQVSYILSRPGEMDQHQL